MAYLREVTDKCCNCREKRAVVELFTWRNSNLGRYCRPCGEKQLKNELNAEVSQRQAYEAKFPSVEAPHDLRT